MTWDARKASAVGARLTLDAGHMRHGPMTFYRNVPGGPIGIPVGQFKE